MLYLTYLSHARTPLLDEELVSLLRRARQFNEQHEITGMLLHKNEVFIQSLEGPEKAVLSLYRKIVQDKRHHQVVLLGVGHIEERNFSNWSMGFACMRWLLKAPVDGLSDVFLRNDLDVEPFTQSNHISVQLIRSFWMADKTAPSLNL